MQKIKSWLQLLRTLKAIAKNYEADQQRITARLSRLRKRIDFFNDIIEAEDIVHGDLHFHDNIHQIIVAGRYRKRDYVRVFFVRAESFTELIDYLKVQEKNADIGRFDIPGHGPSFQAIYSRTGEKF